MAENLTAVKKLHLTEVRDPRALLHSSFAKVDHSARSDRIVLVEYTTGSVVELNFCQKFGKDLTGFWQIIIIKQMVNIYQRFDKVLA